MELELVFRGLSTAIRVHGMDSTPCRLLLRGAILAGRKTINHIFSRHSDSPNSLFKGEGIGKAFGKEDQMFRVPHCHRLSA